MGNEPLHPDVLMNGMIDFMRMGTQQGVSNFTLEGPVNVPTVFTVIAGLYAPNVLNRESTCAIVTTVDVGKEALLHYHSRILHLAIPERIKALNLQSSILIREALKRRMSLNGKPYVVIGFGTPQGTDDSSVLLACVAGMPPQTALREFQDKSRQRLAFYQ